MNPGKLGEEIFEVVVNPALTTSDVVEALLVPATLTPNDGADPKLEKSGHTP